MAEKERIYGERYPIDEDFLAALAEMPAASGIALGLDRLVMLATGADNIEQVIWTPVAARACSPDEAKRNPGAILQTTPHSASLHAGYGSMLRRPLDLVAAGLAPAAKLAELEAVAARYAVSITPAMVALIDSAAPNDPVARQFIPDVAELERKAEEREDPIGDGAHEAVPGLIHRYPDRVLLKLSNVCPVYCRFCFRRETVGAGGPAHLSDAELDQALAYITADQAIWEVIVTGGDPLILSPRRLAKVSAGIAAIPHVEILRWHTRVPLVAPERIDAAMLAALSPPGVTTWLALHANHPREFTPEGCAAVARLADAGIPLVSQTVLLRGVNDDTETLTALMRAFVRNRVKPYYLHHGDLAPGTSHFRASVKQGQTLMRSLRGDVSGLCQPTYVLDIPGGHGKAPIGPGYLQKLESGGLIVSDPAGVAHPYPPTIPPTQHEV
jgi:lysine 2,3-aminomutase